MLNSLFLVLGEKHDTNAVRSGFEADVSYDIMISVVIIEEL